MKKILSLFLLLFMSISPSFAEFRTSGQVQRVGNLAGIDFVLVFNGFSGAEIRYEASEERNFIWQRYIQATGMVEDILAVTDTITTLPEIESGMSYILDIDNGTLRYYFFVFNYENYVPTINHLTIDTANTDCYNMAFLLNVTFDDMQFFTPTTQGVISRNAHLSYNTLQRDNNQRELQETTGEITINSIVSSENNTFTHGGFYADSTRLLLFADQFARAFNYHNLPTSTAVLRDTIRAVATMVHIWGVTDSLALNVLNRQDGVFEGRDLESSARANVNLSAAANLRNGFFEWTIENELGIRIGRSTAQAFQFTFSDAGQYTIRVTFTAPPQGDLPRCVSEDEITIRVWESEIETPNVFTPNGDGINDRFCIAFKSLLEYEIWIYNRWGRLVFHSTNPEACWDGYIGNTPAPIGVYFYRIEAIGADSGRRYRLQGDINLLR